MKKRRIHSTDIEVSSLGLGTVKFGRNEQVKYPEGFELPSDREILELLDTAQEEGINLLDTAPAYGTSEKRLGALLGGHRDDWVIVSKAGEDFIGGKSVFDFSKEAITASVERSLRRLKTDRIEAVLLHSDGNDVDILENSGAVPALQAMKNAGKILAFGISTKTVEGGKLAVSSGMDIVMATYNPWYEDEKPVLDAAQETGCSVFLKKALGSGWFGKDVSGSEKSESPVASAFRFIFDHPASTAVIAGTINRDHLRENCRTMRQVEVGT